MPSIFLSFSCYSSPGKTATPRHVTMSPSARQVRREVEIARLASSAPSCLGLHSQIHPGESAQKQIPCKPQTLGSLQFHGSRVPLTPLLRHPYQHVLPTEHLLLNYPTESPATFLVTDNNRDQKLVTLATLLVQGFLFIYQ